MVRDENSIRGKKNHGNYHFGLPLVTIFATFLTVTIFEILQLILTPKMVS